MARPLVSICTITYNHEAYVKQCLDGILMQQCNFPIEIIINDDHSTDCTKDILNEYASKYPEVIKVEHNPKNLGSNANFNHNLSRARGKYIALCEGDDYWIDSRKLQRQVDFLESHPEYSLTCTNACVLGLEGDMNWKRYDKDCVIPLKDIILKRGAWIYTASMLYRRELMQDFPDYARQCHVGDYPWAIHLALRGKVYFFADKMVTYRFMTPGSWSSTTKINEGYFNAWCSEIRMLQGYNKASNERYCKYFERVMGKLAIFYLRKVPSMKNKVLEVLPDFPKWLDLGDKLKWWKIKLGVKSSKYAAS